MLSYSTLSFGDREIKIAAIANNGTIASWIERTQLHFE